MVDIVGLAHFAIPVSDLDKSTRFYADVVGCKYISKVRRRNLRFSMPAASASSSCSARLRSIRCSKR